MVDADAIRRELLHAFPNGRVEAEDSTGTNDHFAVTVVSDRFDGKSLVERHQMVYRALAGLMPQIHALQLRTTAPGEA